MKSIEKILEKKILFSVVRLSKEVGAGHDFWIQLIKSENKKIFSDFVCVLKNKASSIEDAMFIMGENFISPNEVKKVLGNTKKIYEGFLNFPDVQFTNDFLIKHRNDFVLVPLCGGLNILDILVAAPNGFDMNFFIKENLKKGWALFRKNPIEKTFGREYQSQVRCLSQNERPANVIESLYCGLFVKNNYFLNTSSHYKDERVLIKEKKILTQFIDNANPSIGLASIIR